MYETCIMKLVHIELDSTSRQSVGGSNALRLQLQHVGPWNTGQRAAVAPADYETGQS
jgi:hypothetical protein